MVIPFHPNYSANLPAWKKFRLVSEGGSSFITAYLKKYSRYENEEDFKERLSVTYNPAYAKGALQMVKNAIFQRLVDVRRTGGGVEYQNAITGANGGVDLRDKSMSEFIGTEVLPDLLDLGKVFVYVDMPPIETGVSKSDTSRLRPYLYTYKAEQVVNWVEDFSTDLGQFKSVLICESHLQVDKKFNLPTDQVEILYKHYYVDGTVNIDCYDKEGKYLSKQVLDIGVIPIVCFNLGQSLLQETADHQIAALQLASSDINFLWKSNFPIYTEQEDPRFTHNQRLPKLNSPGTAEVAFDQDTLEGRITQQLEGEDDHKRDPSRLAGNTKGIKYPKGTDRPDFIHPSSEPVTASIEKQKQISSEIRELADLALTSLAARYASAKSKQSDQMGLEAGLSWIGLVLNNGERLISQLWTQYKKAEPASIIYPDNYSLRNDEDRRKEAKEINELSERVSSLILKKELTKQEARILLGHKVDPSMLEKIFAEIDKLPGLSSSSDLVIKEVEAGILDRGTAAAIRGYPTSVAKKAKEEHIERAKAIAIAQADASARGVPDLSADNSGGSAEKEKSRQTDLETSTKKPVRGDGK